MPNDQGRLGKPDGGWTVLGHFASCWRGENGLKETFLASVLVFAAIYFPLGLLSRHAEDAGWPRSAQSTILMLGLVGVIFVVAWFTVSTWRSARRGFLLGQRFWPIVASMAAVLAPTIAAAWFLSRLIESMVR